MTDWLARTSLAHGNEPPAIVEVEVGANHVIGTIDVPRPAVEKSTSVRSVLAMRTAPSMLSCPEPCSNMSAPAIGWAVYSSSIFIMLGVSFLLTCRSNAAAPAATGADIDVPLKYICALRFVAEVSGTPRAGFLVFIALSRDLEETSLFPGATMSGLM